MNDAPIVANPIADQIIYEDALYSFQIPTNTFADVDAGDILRYEATKADGSSLPSWLTFNAITSTFSGTPVKSDVGMITIRVTATDAASASVFDEFVLHINAVNHAPNVTPVIEQEIDEDTELHGQVEAHDIDGDELEYTLQTSALHGTIVVGSKTGSYVYRPNANYNGSDFFTIAVSDGQGGVSSVKIDVIVTPVNDPVQLSNNLVGNNNNGIISFRKGQSLIVNMADVFTDPDGDTLEYIYSMESGSSMNVNRNASMLTFTMGQSGSVTKNVKLSARDNSSATWLDHSLSVSVTSFEEELRDRTIGISEGFSEINLTQYFDTTGVFSVSNSNNENVEAILSGNLLKIRGKSLGTSTVMVTVVDGHGGKVQDSFNVQVLPPFEAHDIGTQPLYNDGYYFGDLDLNDIFSGAVEYRITARDEGVLITSNNIYIESDAPFSSNQLRIMSISGNVSFTIEARNAAGQTATYTVHFKANSRPYYEGPHSLVVIKGDTFNWNITNPPVFSDEDNDELTYSVTLNESNGSIASVGEIIEGVVPITGIELGATSLWIAASDGNGGNGEVPVSLYVVNEILNYNTNTVTQTVYLGPRVSAFPEAASVVISNQDEINEQSVIGITPDLNYAFHITPGNEGGEQAIIFEVRDTNGNPIGKIIYYIRVIDIMVP
ncbi:putative Ig domain protein [compost metagenome]